MYIRVGSRVLKWKKMLLTKLVNSVPIISALALSACQTWPDKILVDYKCSSGEVALIEAAIKEWSLAADSSEVDIPLSLGFNSDQDPNGFLDQEESNEGIIYKIQSTNPGYSTLKERVGYDLGAAGQKFVKIVFIEDRINDLVSENDLGTYGEVFYRIALHEYGHFLGLEHLANPDSLMAPFISKTNCIDQETLDYYCSINDCGANKHSTCLE